MVTASLVPPHSEIITCLNEFTGGIFSPLELKKFDISMGTRNMFTVSNGK